jgi:hypothetical protein
MMSDNILAPNPNANIDVIYNNAFIFKIKFCYEFLVDKIFMLRNEWGLFIVSPKSILS